MILYFYGFIMILLRNWKTLALATNVFKIFWIYLQKNCISMSSPLRLATTGILMVEIERNVFSNWSSKMSVSSDFIKSSSFIYGVEGNGMIALLNVHCTEKRYVQCIFSISTIFVCLHNMFKPTSVKSIGRAPWTSFC